MKKEVAAFEARLAELQTKMKLGGFISAVKTVKNVTTVKVIGVMMTPPATTENRAPRPSAGGWASKGSKDVTALLKAELGGWSKK